MAESSYEEIHNVFDREASFGSSVQGDPFPVKNISTGEELVTLASGWAVNDREQMLTSIVSLD